jgi:hypothetical protein
VHRWVRYEAPVMVCVAIDDYGAERVVNVVIGEELEDIRLARNAEGQPLIYDEHMELLDPNDHTAQRAAREAEDRGWPDPDEWEGGPDAAVREIARVLRLGGRVGITDITADRGRLPAELTRLAAWVACVADARPAAEYERLLEEQGLTVTTVEQHHTALDRMIGHIEARLDLLRMTARPSVPCSLPDCSSCSPPAAEPVRPNGPAAPGPTSRDREPARTSRPRWTTPDTPASRIR